MILITGANGQLGQDFQKLFTGLGLEFVATVASEINAIYVTYSSDFVFDGTKGSPYVETDLVNPISVYAESKAQGEKAVLSAYNKSFVIRTSLVS